MDPIEKAKQKIQAALVNNSDALDLSGLELTTAHMVELVPTINSMLPNLQELCLNDNLLTEVPPEIGRLAHLRVLEVKDNRLTRVSETVAHLGNLEYLALAGNQLTYLPLGMSQLHQLKGLDLNDNKFDTFPEQVLGLRNLVELYIGDNRISQLPEEIGNLDYLNKLVLEGNRLDALPESMRNLENLEQLSLAKNRFAEFPSALVGNTYLKELNLSENLLSTIPREIGSLTGLVKLEMAKNGLGTVPETIELLENLIDLDLGENKLGRIPPQVLGLTRLQFLGLNENDISEVPSNFNNLQALKSLRLNGNAFTTIPSEILDLGDLKVLDFSANRLSSVPDGIDRLTNLEVLGLHNNDFNLFPSELAGHISLKALDISGNNISEVPEQVGRELGLNILNINENPLGAQTMIFLQSLYGDNVNFHKAPFALDNHSAHVLQKLYPLRKPLRRSKRLKKWKAKRKAAKIDALDLEGPFRDAEGNLLNAQQVIYGLLTGIPHDEARADQLFFEAGRELMDTALDPSLGDEAVVNKLHQISTALGNCVTPVLDLLVQVYLGMYNQESQASRRPENFETIIQREALQKEINNKLANAVDENGERIMPNLEKIEQVQALVNAVFLEGAAEDSDNKVKLDFSEGGPKKLPSKTEHLEFGYNQVKPELATAFAKLVCKTDPQGNLDRTAAGHFIFDSQKMQRIVNKYKNAMGEKNTREAMIAKYEVDMQKLLFLEKNENLILSPDHPQVKELLNFEKAKDQLRDQLYEANEEELNNVYKTFLADKTNEINVLAEKFSRNVAEELGSEHSQGSAPDLAGLTVPQNEALRSSGEIQPGRGHPGAGPSRSTPRRPSM